MKKNHILLVIISLLGTIVPTNAQTMPRWGPGSGIENLVFNDGGTHIVFLDGDVTINGTITVDNKTTLRILGRNDVNNNGQNIDNSKPLTINVGYGHAVYYNGILHRSTPVFRVIGDAKLAFNYNDVNADGPFFDETTKSTIIKRYNPIIIDGSANFSEMDISGDIWTLNAGNEREISASVIESIGAVEMFNVTMRNINIAQHDRGGNVNNESGVIGLATLQLGQSMGYNQNSNCQYRYTRLWNCVVEKCKAVSGTFLIVGGGTYLNRNIDPTSSDLYGANRRIIIQDCTIQNNISYSDVSGWGGLIRFRGGSPYCLELRNNKFQYNFTHGDGSTLFWNAGGHLKTKCTIDGCKFINNRAMRDAGALRLEGSFEFVGNPTYVTGNQCLGRNKDNTENTNYGYGGGIQIYGYAGTSGVFGGEGKPIIHNLPTCLIVENNIAANYGGGISLNIPNPCSLIEKTTITANINGVVIKNNEAKNGGGGIFFNDNSDPNMNYSLNILLNRGEIEGNVSSNGGGLYMKDIDINSNESETIYIRNNKAVAGNGGGIYIENANISLSRAVISGNSASYKGRILNVYGGGGVFVSGGSFSMETGSITQNTTSMYGGGVLVQNESSITKNINLAGGEVIGNSAEFGGGIAAYGNLDLTINDVKIESNEALNGGGLFTQGSSSTGIVKLQYSKGLIRENKALNKSFINFSTAYNKLHSDVAGIGGGVYLDQYSRMTFPNPNEFGIYNNRADVGADDIFGSNNYVQINLPNISELNLTEYNAAKIHELYWGEDYITNDIYYGNGLKLKGDLWDSDRTNQRYRDVLERKVEGNYYVIDFGNRDYIQYTDKYLSLTVGWYVSALKIYKEGMKDGENAIFKIYKVDGSSLTEYMTVVLTDADKVDDNVRLKQVVLKNDGTYRIVETGWSWAYDANVNSIQRTLNTSSKPEDYEFRFKNTEKSNSSRRDEDIKINKMKF